MYKIMTEKYVRPSWDEYFMEIANAVSSRATWQDIYVNRQLRLMVGEKATKKTVGAVDVFDFERGIGVPASESSLILLSEARAMVWKASCC